MQFYTTWIFRSANTKKFQHHKCKPDLNNTFVKGALKKLQYHFAAAPIAKAANNISYISFIGFMLLPYLNN